MALYVIARTVKGRPTLQHKVNGHRSRKTVCGQPLNAWRKDFMPVPLPVLLCLKCKGII